MKKEAEGRIHSKGYNLVDWRNTLRCAVAAKRRWEREIVRPWAFRMLVGTAFGTARLIEFALSANWASLFSISLSNPS
jgi:hypothetical protein